MLKPLLSTIFLITALAGFSQSYSYSFSGDLDQEQLLTLEKEVSELKFSEKVKVNYKPEQHLGEILFIQIIRSSSGDNSSTESPTSIKRILINSGLNPLSFNEIGK